MGAALVPILEMWGTVRNTQHPKWPGLGYVPYFLTAGRSCSGELFYTVFLLLRIPNSGAFSFSCYRSNTYRSLKNKVTETCYRKSTFHRPEIIESIEVPSQRGVRVLGIRVGSSHWILLCVLFRAMWIYYYLFRKQNVSFQTFSPPISIQPAVISSFVPHCFPVLTLLTQRWSCPSPPFFFFFFWLLCLPGMIIFLPLNPV